MATLGDELLKTGARAFTHARSLIFQMVEMAIPRRLFAAILERIRRLRMCETVPSGTELRIRHCRRCSFDRSLSKRTLAAHSENVLANLAISDRIVREVDGGRPPEAIRETPVDAGDQRIGDLETAEPLTSP